MYQIQTLNAISDIIYSQLPAERYAVSKECDAPDGVLVRSAAMHEMEFKDNLLAIARAGAGVNNIPIDRCSKAGICVFNTPGANANAVAELVMAGLLLSSRNVVGGIEWAKGLQGQEGVAKLVEKGKSQFVGPELRGKTLGVIGLGAIGAIVANAASRGFGMRVVGYDPFISVESAWSLSTTVHRAGSADEVLQQADYITWHIPLTDQTRGSINAETIAKLKDGVRLLNFSRAELINFDDMKAALASGKVAQYVTDFPTEQMLGVEHVLCIPHLGASTPESEENCAAMASAQLRDYLETGSIHNSVNLPELPLGAPEGYRVFVIHENVPNMVTRITGAISAEGINIETVINKSRKSMAVTVMETHVQPSAHAIETLSALDGVNRVRVFGA